MKSAVLFATLTGITSVFAWGIPGVAPDAEGCLDCSVEGVDINCGKCWGADYTISGDLNDCYTNDNGQLRKGGGGWADSCKDWSANGSGVLTAQCKNKAGTYVETSTNLADGHLHSGEESVVC